jgi:acetyltransferase-like isoleucine patch superfamily enzyme
MMKTYKLLTFLAVLALLVFPAGPAYAQGTGTDGGKVIFGNNFTLESGDTFEGDLVVFGGNVTVEDDAQLNGNLVVFGGTISSDGDVSGDVVIIGGQVNLQDHAVVNGNLVTIGGQVDRAEGAVVEGDVVNNVPPEIEIPSARVPPEVVVPNVPQPNFDFNFNPFVQFFQVFSWAIIIAAFAMLLMLFWQAPIERAGNTIVSQPLMSGAIGLVATFVGILFALTIIPPIVVAFAWLFGVVAMGREVGERFATAINQRWTPVITAGTGTFLLMVVGGAIGMIPCLGGLVLFLLGLLGVGGAISTWFNLQPALRPSVPVYTPPTDTGEIPPAS